MSIHVSSAIKFWPKWYFHLPQDFLLGGGVGGGGGRRGVGMGLLWVENTLGLLMLQLINPFNKL